MGIFQQFLPISDILMYATVVVAADIKPNSFIRNRKPRIDIEINRFIFSTLFSYSKFCNGLQKFLSENIGFENKPLTIKPKSNIGLYVSANP